MDVFFTVAIIALIVSNVLLWLIVKGLQIMIKNLCKTIIELGKIMEDGANETH